MGVDERHHINDKSVDDGWLANRCGTDVTPVDVDRLARLESGVRSALHALKPIRAMPVLQAVARALQHTARREVKRRLGCKPRPQRGLEHAAWVVPVLQRCHLGDAISIFRRHPAGRLQEGSLPVLAPICGGGGVDECSGWASRGRSRVCAGIYIIAPACQLVAEVVEGNGLERRSKRL